MIYINIISKLSWHMLNYTIGEEYACSITALINDWRNEWSSNSDTNSLFPFGFVQLSTWSNSDNQTCGNNVNEFDCNVGFLRWAQTAYYGIVPNDAMENVFMATAIDLGYFYVHHFLKTHDSNEPIIEYEFLQKRKTFLQYINKFLICILHQCKVK